VVLATRRQGWRGFVGRTNGGMVVHLGVVVVAVAIAASGSYAHEVEARYAPGDTRVVGGHEITYVETTEVEEEHRTATKVRVRVDGGQIYEPALSRFPGFGQLIGTPSVKTGLTEDVYLTVTRLADEPGGEVTLRVIIQPMAIWLWIGGGVMAVGAVLAAWPGRRRRRPTDPVSAGVPDGMTTGDGAGTGEDDERQPVGVD
jgi:cytochrome c-type biogenesis protein CcmF